MKKMHFPDQHEMYIPRNEVMVYEPRRKVVIRGKMCRES